MMGERRRLTEVDLQRLDDDKAMAALCLRGRPFGFTREDLEELRARGHMADIAMDPRREPGWGKLHSIADRIEALLPPEVDKCVDCGRDLHGCAVSAGPDRISMATKAGVEN